MAANSEIIVDKNHNEKTLVITVPFNENGGLTFSLTEKQAWGLMSAIFAAFSEDDVCNALDRTDREASPEIVHEIADRLFDEIQSDELYWELEDNNIFYIYDNLIEEKEK